MNPLDLEDIPVSDSESPLDWGDEPSIKESPLDWGDEPVKPNKNIPVIKPAPEEGLLKKGGRKVRELLSPLIGETERQKEIARAEGRLDSAISKAPIRDIAGSMYEFGTTPLVNLKPGTIDQATLGVLSSLPGMVGEGGKVLKGVTEGVYDVGSSLTSPLGIATLGMGTLPKVAQKAVSGAFAADMASHVPEQARELGKVSVEGDTSEISRAATGITLNTLFAAGAGAHAMPGFKRSKAELTKTEPAPTPKPEPPIPFMRSAEAEIFNRTDPSGLSMAVERPSPAPFIGEVPANPAMLELIQQGSPEVVSFPNTVRATLGAEPVSPIQPTRKVSAIGREQGTVQPGTGETIITPREGRFVVDERGAVIQADPRNITSRDVAKIKSTALVPENAIALTEKIGEADAKRIYVDEKGNARIGPFQPEAKGTPIDLTLNERIALELEVDRQVNEAISLAVSLQTKQPKVSQRVVDKNLPPRPGMNPEEAAQIATQFQQRVPSEQSRGVTEFDRPANPQIRQETQKEVQGTLEEWANEKIKEGKKRLNTGLDPELLAAYSIKGASLLTKGVVNGGEWSSAMIKEFGKEIRPYLNEVRRQSENVRINHFRTGGLSEPSEQIKTAPTETAPIKTGTPKDVPLEYIGEQPGFGTIKGFSLYNVMEDIPGHPKGSTVSGPVLEKMGFALPEKVTQTEASPSSLGIAPGAAQFEAVYNKTKQLWSDAKKTGADPVTEVILDTSTPFPDFQPTPVSKKVLNTPFGMERIPILGRIFGDRSKVKTPVEESVTAFAGESEIGRAISSAFGEEIRGRIDSQFEVENGQITNITPTREGQSLHPSDVLESLQKDPNSYILNPEQRSAFEFMSKLDKDMRKLEDKYELFQDPEGEYSPGKPSRRETYFPRVVIERPAEVVSGGGKRVGSKQFFQKERMFESESEGASKGFKYEPSLERRLVTRAERLYQAIAAKRLAQDPALQGRTRTELESDLKDYYAEEVASGIMTESKLSKMADSIQREGSVDQPAFFGKIYDRETANTLKKAFPNTDNSFRKNFVKGNNALKAIRLSLDLGVSQLQGLPTLFSNPAIWGKAVGNSVQALFSERVFPEYVRKNLPEVREMAQLGSSVGRLQEMLAGAQKGELVTRIPVVGKGFEAFGRQFQTFLDTAKLELWKSQKEITPKEQWPELIQAIESQLAIGRMEGVGLSQRRAMMERAVLLAPSYYRGALNLVQSIGRSGASGRVSRKAIGSYLAGGTLAYIGGGLALGMTVEELFKRLNPARSDFMMLNYKNEDGKTINFGFGGIYRSLLRLAGNVTKTAIENPGNFGALDSDRNPFSRWLRGHSAPIPGITWDALSGRDYMGGETDAGTVLQSALPMIAQPIRRMVNPKEGEPKASPLETGMTFLGMSSYPLSENREKQEKRKEISQSEFKKDYDKLSLGELVKVSRETEKSFPEKKVSTPRQREMAYKADIERQKRLQGKIEFGDELKKLGLKVTGYDPSITIRGSRIFLPKEDTEKYENFIVEEYNKMITPDVVKRLEDLPGYLRQEFLNKRLSKARETARARITRELK